MLTTPVSAMSASGTTSSGFGSEGAGVGAFWELLLGLQRPVMIAVVVKLSGEMTSKNNVYSMEVSSCVCIVKT